MLSAAVSRDPYTFQIYSTKQHHAEEQTDEEDTNSDAAFQMC